MEVILCPVSVVSVDCMRQHQHVVYWDFIASDIDTALVFNHNRHSSEISACGSWKKASQAVKPGCRRKEW